MPIAHFGDFVGRKGAFERLPEHVAEGLLVVQQGVFDLLGTTEHRVLDLFDELLLPRGNSRFLDLAADLLG